jgi:hypothetical protein
MEGLDSLRKTCVEQIADLTDAVISGGCGDYAAYSNATGAVSALNRVLWEIDSIKKKYLEE